MTAARDRPRGSPLRHVSLDAVRIAWLILNVLRFFAGPIARHLLRLPQRGMSLGMRTRRFCESMGITYVKLGQYLAMRFDILPAEICKELENLFDAVRRLPFASIQLRIEQELGRPLEELYASFEHEPLAAASVAQVHRARTRSGDLVAVKVQRPGIERVLLSDLRTLLRFARLGDRLRLLGPTSIVEMVGEFGAYTLREMDFVTEGKTADRLRFNAGPFEYIPRVYWDYTSTRVLTLEFVEGISVSKACELLVQGREDELREFAGGDIAPAISNFAKASLRQLFVTGFFHGDPHPGNILFRRDTRVVFLDFGIFGAMTPLELEIMGSFIENLAFGNIDASLYHYERLAIPSPDTDVPAFRNETKAILTRWYEASRSSDASIADRHLGTYWGKMLDVFRRHHVKMSPDQLLFWRALLTLDATALRVAARFDILKEMQSFFREVRPSIGKRIDALFHDDLRNLYLRDLALRLPEMVHRAGAYARGEAVPSIRAVLQQEARARKDASGVDAIAALLVSSALAAVGAATQEPATRMLAGAGAAIFGLSAIFGMRGRWR